MLSRTSATAPRVIGISPLWFAVGLSRVYPWYISIASTQQQRCTYFSKEFANVPLRSPNLTSTLFGTPSNSRVCVLQAQRFLSLYEQLYGSRLRRLEDMIPARMAIPFTPALSRNSTE